MILNTNTNIIIINPNNNNVSYFNNDLVELRKYNKQGWNVYYILNDFESKRTIDDLVGFKWIGIDLDMQNKDTNKAHEGLVKDILNICNNKLNFLPTKINRTFKGFHILFKISDDLYSLDKEQYVKLYKKINEILGGDLRMKDITAILKMEGFIDNKNNRKFVIKNEFFDIRNEINSDIIKNILNEKPKLDIKRVNDFQTKFLKRKRNYSMFEDIDALDFIKSINENNDVFKGINIVIHKDNSIDNTSGLKIYNDNGFHRIKDFSGKNRFGNRLFLYNYVIKELMGIKTFKVDKKTRFKDDNEKKEYELKLEGVKKIEKIIGFLSNTFGIKFNKKLNKEPISNSYIEQTFRKNQLHFDDDIYNELTHQE